MANKNVPPEVSAFFAELGRKNGKKLMEERGSDYFSKIASMRKTHGRQGKGGPENQGTYQSLANKYGVSKQRIEQIIKKQGESIFKKENFQNEFAWREAVVEDYFSKKQ